MWGSRRRGITLAVGRRFSPDGKDGDCWQRDTLEPAPSGSASSSTSDMNRQQLLREVTVKFRDYHVSTRWRFKAHLKLRLPSPLLTMWSCAKHHIGYHIASPATSVDELVLPTGTGCVVLD